jgi:WD40-like Beta Propeller Repeat
MDADGTDLTFLTSGSQPAWSPDGSMILFVRAYDDPCAGGPITRIRGIAPDGTDERQLTHDYTNCDYYNEESLPEWAPAANRYVIKRDDEGLFFWVALEILAVGEDQGTMFGDYPEGAGWSPDGTLIAYSPYGDSVATILPDAPYTESVLVDTPGSDTHPDWQPLPVNTPSSHVRPKSAAHVKATLVPAFRPCTSPNRQHGPPLAYDSCAPPQPGSPRLIVGVGDGHAAPSRSIGFVRLRLSAGVPGGADDTTAPIRVLITNVMRTADLTEYTGELLASIRVRITDKDGAVSSTLRDFPVEAKVPCVPTESTGVASTCDLATELDALIPGATPEGTRAVWALDQVRLYDGGPDGDADTSAGNALFAVQGVFVP